MHLESSLLTLNIVNGILFNYYSYNNFNKLFKHYEFIKSLLTSSIVLFTTSLP